MLAIVGARIVFAPLFLLCHSSGSTAFQLPLLAFDAAPIILILVFSFLNGMLTSSTFVASQATVGARHHKAAASVLVLALNSGIFVGACLSFVVRFANCKPAASNGFDCNPFISGGGGGNATAALGW